MILISIFLSKYTVNSVRLKFKIYFWPAGSTNGEIEKTKFTELLRSKFES